MALIPCRECKKIISDQASSCPQCGAPSTANEARPPFIAKQVPNPNLVLDHKTPLTRGQIVGAAALVLIMLAIAAKLTSSGEKSPDVSSSKTSANACAPGDLKCFGERGIVAAGTYCRSQIELQAPHSMRWTDATFQSKFDRYRWHDKDRSQVTYVGNRAEFQNGFGAFTPVIYECDLAPDEKTVIGVRVREGRLP